MNDLHYKTFITSEMNPDVYAGDNCDQIRPRWWSYADGDMDGDFINTLEFNCKDFPPGTRVILSLPCCPQCGQDSEMCSEYEGCDFDWKNWTDEEYS